MERYAIKTILSASEVDLLGRWRPGAIFVSMQETAIAHADLLGCGRDPLLKDGMFWAVFRTQLHMDDYPLMNDEVVITTWPGKTNRGMFPRYHTFESPQGKRYGAASSLWLIVDRDSRNMITQPNLPTPMPDTSAYAPPLPYPQRTAMLEAPVVLHDLAPVYTDLDVNQHVNNAKYIDWVCNLLPLEMVKTHILDDIIVNYLKEIRPDQALRLEVQTLPGEFSLVAKDAEQGQPCFEASGHLTPWVQTRFFL